MHDIFRHSCDTLLGRADPRLKMGIGLSMSILVVLADGLFLLSVLAGSGAALCVLSRPSRSQVRLILFSSALLVWGLMFSQGIFYNRYPRTILLVLWPPGPVFPEGLHVYAEGVRYGMMQSLRMLAVSLTGYAICFTTEPGRFFRALTAIRVPFALAFMAVTAIRFVPIAAREFAMVRTAMRLKGYRPFRNGLAATVRSEVGALRPILAGTIRRSEEVAVSIVARGFTLGERRTCLHEERLSRREWALLAALAAMVTGVLCFKTLFWLYQREMYFASSLRWVYQIAREWM